MEAKYTMLFKDWLSTNTTEPPLPVVTYRDLLKSELNNKYSNVDANTLVKMLENVYNYYEIGTDEKFTMLLFLRDVFNEYGPYYNELIGNYNKEYDYAKNNKRVVRRNDTLNIAGSSKLDNHTDGKNTEYVLPNKVTDDNYESTPSGITKDVNDYKQDKVYDNNTTRDSETETEFNNEFIDLKNKYLNQIRNVYREFAMKFKECFYQIY